MLAFALQGNYPDVTFSVLNLARSGIDVAPAAMCWYQLAPQVCMLLLDNMQDNM
jgi:hypothetical protein